MARKGELTEVGSDKDEIVARLPLACSSEQSAVAFFEEMRWGGEAWCPRCLSTKVYAMVGRDGRRQIDHRWRCRDCKRQFTVRIGTVLEESRIPLRHWAYAFWRAATSKKGVSALEIKRQTGLTYKSALFLMHRIRWAMAPEQARPLDGTVEVDETYVGGKPRYKGTREQRGESRKIPVVALVERGGEVRARVVPNVTAKTLKTVIRQHVDMSARLMTDESRIYWGVGAEFRGGHESVNHGRGEYVRGDVTTNTVEGFFSLLKRGIYGTFHSVSDKHLHRYVSEFEFRYNWRKESDGTRTALAIRSAEGKRLTYKQPRP
jgi:transposase-like protein